MQVLCFTFTCQFVFHCNVNTSSVELVLDRMITTVLLFQCNCTYPAFCNINEDLLFGRGEVYVVVGICLIRWNCFQVNVVFFFNFFIFPESGSVLQLIFDGKYEAIFSNSTIRNVFSASSVAEEDIESYLEKQILMYLDCSTEVDNMER